MMRSLGMIGAALLILLCAVAGASDCPCTEGPSGRGGESPEGKADRLERIIADQETLIGLLMENLANCTEENEARGEGRAAGSGDEGYVRGEKMRLMGRLQAALHTEEHLGFLNVLSEDRLARLVELVEGISKGDGSEAGHGDPERRREDPAPGSPQGKGPGAK
jgi:hypothetical protein